MKKEASDAGVAVIAEIGPIFSGKLMTESTDKMSLMEQVHAHVILKKVGEAVETRLKEIRTPLMATADAKGELAESGTRTYEVEGSKVAVQHRKPKLPPKEPLKKLLLECSIPVMDVFDEVKVLEVNASKLNYLVDTGKLTKEAVQKLLDEDDIPTLIVYPSKALKTAVSSLGIGKSEEKALSE